jgi:hypothetical protein
VKDELKAQEEAERIWAEREAKLKKEQEERYVHSSGPVKGIPEELSRNFTWISEKTACISSNYLLCKIPLVEIPREFSIKPTPYPGIFTPGRV